MEQDAPNYNLADEELEEINKEVANGTELQELENKYGLEKIERYKTLYK